MKWESFVLMGSIIINFNRLRIGYQFLEIHSNIFIPYQNSVSPYTIHCLLFEILVTGVSLPPMAHLGYSGLTMSLKSAGIIIHLLH